jgi:predicted kinase
MKQFMVIIDGPMGSGKTTIGSLVQKKLKRTAHISSDRIKWFVSDFKRNEADKEMTARLVQALCEEYIKQGINLIIPQGFWLKKYLDPYIKLAKKHKLSLLVYQLKAPKNILIERVLSRPKPREAQTSITKSRVLKNLKKWEENKYQSEKVFDTSLVTPQEVAKSILSDIKKATK